MSSRANEEFTGIVAEPAKRDDKAAKPGVAISERVTPDSPLSGKRVLYVVPQPFFEDRGSPIAVLQVVRAMSELGINVDMLAFPSGKSVNIKNLRIFRCGTSLGIQNIPIGFSLKKIVLDFASLFALRARLKAESYDCIHALEDGVYVALAAGASGRIPIIYDMHSCIPEQLEQHWILGTRFVQSLLKKLERFALRRATVVSCSVGLKDYIKACVPGTRVAEWTFSDPSNDDVSVRELDEPAKTLREKLGIKPDARVILYAGNFKEYQGVDILVDSMARVTQAHPDAVLVLLGASVSDDVEQIRRRGRGSIIICPRQPHQLVPNYLHMAQILVSPRTTGDNLPLKLFEYLAAGKPIVATDNKHHRMVLQEDRAVFADCTSESLAKAIIKLLDEPDTMQRLAAAAKTYSDKNLGWSNFVQSVATLYETALQKPANED